MYEIWLALNIVYELALDLWPLLLVIGLVWIGVLAARRKTPGRVSLYQLAGIAVAVAFLVGLALPSFTLSGFGNFGYWVDWANWLAIALGVGVAAAVWVWPWLPRRARS